MKTQKRTLTIITLLAFFMFNACGVIELETPDQISVPSPVGTPATEADLISALTKNDSREWQALTFQLEGLDGFQSCRLDDTFIFFNDGTYRYDGGEVLCGGADDARVKTGLWELDFEALEITFDRGTSLASLASISGLENNRMELRGQVEIFGQRLAIQGIYEYVD